MTTADWALVISLCSMLIALFSLGWNIWSKFIYPKPRVRTYISIMEVMDSSGSNLPHVALSATNFGPNEVTLHLAIAKSKRKFFHSKSKVKHAMLTPYNNFPIDLTARGPFGGGLPKKVGIGEDFVARFPITKDWVEEGELFYFGFTDTFGRKHWCSRKNGKDFWERVLEHCEEEENKKAAA